MVANLFGITRVHPIIDCETKWLKSYLPLRTVISSVKELCDLFFSLPVEYKETRHYTSKQKNKQTNKQN